MTSFYLRLISASALFLSLGCHRAARSEDPVGNEFLTENPTYTLVSTSDAELDGDEQHSKITLRYQKPNDKTIHVDIWHYKSAGYLKWKLISKETKN